MTDNKHQKELYSAPECESMNLYAEGTFCAISGETEGFTEEIVNLFS